MKWLSLLALAPLALAFPSARTPNLDRHTEALKKVGTVSLTLRVTELGSAPVEHKLVLAGPNRLRWESPAGLTVADGKVVVRWDREKNRYTEEPAGPGLGLLGKTPAWAWSSLIDPDFGKSVVSESRGASRRVGGKAVQELVVQRRDLPAVTLFLDGESGIAVGGTYRTEVGKEVVLQVTDLKLGADAATLETFAWKAPAGATKAAAADLTALKFGDVRPVLDRSCRCHLGGGSAGGVTLGSFAEVRRLVTPGQPTASRLIRVIQSGRMPPMGPLPKTEVDRLAKWVQDGAVE